MALLENYDWPGNVRELENTMERSVALETGPTISMGVLPEKIRFSASPGAGAGASAVPQNEKPVFLNGGVDLEKYLQDTERAYIMAALEASGGVGTRAAEMLKMSYRSFRHVIKKYNIS
jgi:two-component system response regulator PilR (NtrC family)